MYEFAPDNVRVPVPAFVMATPVPLTIPDIVKLPATVIELVAPVGIATGHEIVTPDPEILVIATPPLPAIDKEPVPVAPIEPPAISVIVRQAPVTPFAITG